MYTPSDWVTSSRAKVTRMRAKLDKANRKCSKIIVDVTNMERAVSALEAKIVDTRALISVKQAELAAAKAAGLAFRASTGPLQRDIAVLEREIEDQVKLEQLVI